VTARINCPAREGAGDDRRFVFLASHVAHRRVLRMTRRDHDFAPVSRDSRFPHGRRSANGAARCVSQRRMQFALVAHEAMARRYM
jgi:hypothetical protein